ncbi:MAG TPA: GAF domain-containing protein, partial [Gammaproteobacteria bacterium]
SGLTSSLINLAINARDAMAKIPGEKLLTIRTRREEIVQGAAHQQQHLRPGWYAVVETTDTGIGMSEAIRAQAFQPLFTTKERGKGTGLGLAMVRGYAEQLGGSASIHSQPDAGTTVCMHLPLELRRAEVDARAEAERLAALDSSGLLDTPADERFDALLGEAARVTGAPIALVSLVDASRQRFKAKLGLSIEETPRETAFCAEAIHHPGKITLVPDAAVDPRFSGSPLVVAEPGIRFYAGVPIRDPQGHALGTLCVLDREPRELDAAQQAQLERLALRVEELIAERLSADRTPRGAGSPRLAQPKRDGLPRVLVVDDEKELCDVAIAWLESLDHEAVAAHTAQQALERLAAQPFDVLFSDVVMPGGMDGIQLAEEAQLRHPGLRIILTSGYADSLLDKNIQVHWPLIRKPYRKSDLAGVLRADPPP